ncbi:OmpA family protein [Chryseobacterium sp. SC28]|uniref:OmpA family protein n=1 Tax=Chryseobacterium sp. SC28 TaxID=2268028 RepID=UPI000F651F78|nr:OmpA family protein [Chryseobacterium sp. SC28]RRQ45603.1 OmpA family protein [Chryseobacterium sp. SC28]
MKNVTKSVLYGLLLFALSCNKNGDKQKVQNQDSTKAAPVHTAQTGNSSTFDINTIPFSDYPLGEFPFFTLPAGLAEQNEPVERHYDRIFFAIKGKMIPIDGKVWKANITTKSGNYDDWSLPFFEKSYDEAIKAAGGVKIFDGKITPVEYDKYHEQAAYLGEDGSIGYPDEVIKTYVIHRRDGGDINIQLSGSTAGGKINILQKEAFKQTITMLNADQIQKDLQNKGKAVLHINFDTDKATLRPEGRQAVGEILKALNADKLLKISINGYTDDTGDENHNLELSKQRAETVKSELIKNGIEADRLSSAGFGENNPIADNHTDEGKAQNRRVELVKK